MKKLIIVSFLVAGVISVASAQSGDIMFAAGARVFGPLCTNCDALFGPAVSGSYAFTEHIAAMADFGIYSRSEGGLKYSAVAMGVHGEFYIKEAYKGFYVAPDVTFISRKLKYAGESDAESDITFGANLGWAIPIANFRIIPHFGYGTWYEDSKGRLTIGAKVGFKLP